jgi:shikimate dehydrogenase
MKNSNDTGTPTNAEEGAPESETENKEGKQPPEHREIGGPPGPEPTRYGDWEKGGRCIDF